MSEEGEVNTGNVAASAGGEENNGEGDIQRWREVSY